MINEILNFEHCDIIERFNPVTNELLAYEAKVHEGWKICFLGISEDDQNIYTNSAIINIRHDFSKIQIVPETQVPKDYLE